MTVAQYMVRQMSGGASTPCSAFRGYGAASAGGVASGGAAPFIVCRHEGAAALMASAYCKASGKPAAVVADSGPGAVQMLNGVYDACMDRVPLLAITGELPARRRDPLAAGRGPRCTVPGSHRLQPHVDGRRPGASRFSLKLYGRPSSSSAGAHRCAAGRLGAIGAGRQIVGAAAELGATVRTDDRAVQRAVAMIEEAEYPVLFAGIGAAQAAGSLLELAERLEIPIVHSMPALGLFPADHPWNMGVVGKFGTQAAAMLGRADLVIAVEPRGGSPSTCRPGAGHPDGQNEGPYRPDVPRRLGCVGRRGRRAAAPRGKAARETKPLGRDRPPGPAGAPRRSGAHELGPPPAAPARSCHRRRGQALVPDAIVSLDVGNHTFWFSRYHRAETTSCSCRGTGAPSALVCPAASGQAGGARAPSRGRLRRRRFAMTMAEFTTAVQYELPIACIVLRDGRFGEEESLQKPSAPDPSAPAFTDADWAAYAQGVRGGGLSCGNV